MQVSGTAVTVLLQPGDNWMMHVVAEQIQPGDIVVAAVTAECTDGYFGDLLATSLPGARRPGTGDRRRGARREDAQGNELSGMEQGHQQQGHDQGDAGSVNIPVVCAGMIVNPGDVIVADDDGVVCVPAARAVQTLEAAIKRESFEGEKRAKLASGVLGLDMYKMREPLAAAGLRYID